MPRLTSAPITTALIVLLTLSVFTSADAQDAANLPGKEKFHIYLLIGQSNMAGRGIMTEDDKQPLDGIMMLNKQNQWVPAKHPLHYDKPKIAGVGLGISFAQAMAKNQQDDDVVIGLVPSAFGGTPLSRWMKGKDLYDAALDRARIAQKTGVIKGILWHQGEAETRNALLAESYLHRLTRAVESWRQDLSNPQLPFVAGELGHFLSSKKYPHYQLVNYGINHLPFQVQRTGVVSAADLKPKNDKVHFDAAALREFGKRYAQVMQAIQSGQYGVNRQSLLAGSSRIRLVGSARGGSDAYRYYKRIHQFAVRDLILGNVSKMQDYLAEYQQKNPADAETDLFLALAAAYDSDPNQADKLLEQSLKNGLPPGRLLCGPDDLFTPLIKTKTYQQTKANLADQLIHGPMLGNITESFASFWVRTAAPAQIRVEVFPAGKSDNTTVASATSETKAENDLTSITTVGSLKPHTSYAYRISVNGQLSDTLGTFKTSVPFGQKTKLTFAFGGGAGYTPQYEHMWNTINHKQPDALLLLGDNIYSDDPESVIQQQYCYYRRQSRPEFRKLVASTAVYSIWDDHDFSTNDSWGGPHSNKPFWKRQQSWKIFRQNWINPGYGGGYDYPGCYYSFQRGDIQFIMLDCRYYRIDPRKPDRTMLGPKQKQWLKQQLAAAKAKFIFIASSVPWDYRTKGDSTDTWNGYRNERDEIFGFIAENKIDGVVLISADRHRSDAWLIERPDSYDLYEFNSSRLTNIHRHPEMNEALFSYNKKPSFGFVQIDTTIPDPTIQYDVVNIDGETIHSLTIQRSQLQK